MEVCVFSFFFVSLCEQFNTQYTSVDPACCHMLAFGLLGYVHLHPTMTTDVAQVAEKKHTRSTAAAAAVANSADEARSPGFAKHSAKTESRVVEVPKISCRVNVDKIMTSFDARRETRPHFM